MLAVMLRIGDGSLENLRHLPLSLCSCDPAAQRFRTGSSVPGTFTGELLLTAIVNVTARLTKFQDNPPNMSDLLCQLAQDTAI